MLLIKVDFREKDIIALLQLKLMTDNDSVNNNSIKLKVDNLKIGDVAFVEIDKNENEIGDELIMYSERKRYILSVSGLEMIPYDNINDNYCIPYIKATTENDTYSGLSGSPIFYKNKLVGIFSKYCKDINTALIIPVYVLIKNIEKKDNQHIYKLLY